MLFYYYYEYKGSMLDPIFSKSPNQAEKLKMFKKKFWKYFKII